MEYEYSNYKYVSQTKKSRGSISHIERIVPGTLLPIPVAARSRRRSSAARLLRLWVRIPPGAWMFVCCECCVLSGRDLCDGLITRPEGFYQLWRVIKTMRKQVNINRSNRWATPEATLPLAKIKSE